MSICQPFLVPCTTPDFTRGPDSPAPPPPGRTTLITKRGTEQQLTSNRETDATVALVRGLKEYLEQLQIETTDARLLLFKKVVEVHSDYEPNAEYPSAAVSPFGDTKYDAAKFTPALQEVLKNQTGIPYARLVLGQASEALVDLQVEVWATSAEARLSLVAMLEDAFLPNDWSSAINLVLPHYHGVHAAYIKTAVQYTDDPVSKSRNLHKAMFKVNARCPVVRMFFKPLGQPRFQANEVGPNNEADTFVDGTPDISSGGGGGSSGI